MSKRGNYYKRKTKQFLERDGYACEYVEKYGRIVKGEKVIFIKKDVFGADIIAMNGKEIVFVNSVLGKKNVAEHLKRFAKYPFPPSVRCWVVVWEVGTKEPEVIEYEKEAR